MEETMNSYANPGMMNAYSAHQRADETVRETEAHALLSCAGRLEAARAEGASMESYIDAIKHNQQLWTIFQVCLCEPDNPLPRDLKILLLNISRYIDKASIRALSHFEPDLLKGLISINRNIAAGLSVKVEGDQPTASKTPEVPADYVPLTTSV
jgi:flagellar protein FlaF